MIKTFNPLNALLCLLLLAGCASETQKPEVKTYSEDTNRAFEMIERGGSYYLKKAPAEMTPPQIEAPKRVMKKATPPPVQQETSPLAQQQVQQAAPLPQEEIVIDEKINYQEKQTLPAPQKIVHTNAKVDERLIEINQNLAFYCMKHRKDAAYGGDEAKCMKYVARVQQKCQNKHRLVNSKLVSCIRNGLKK